MGRRGIAEASFDVVDQEKLMTPTDDFVAAFPGLNFGNHRNIQTNGEPVLLVDPIYIADVYNSADESADYVRSHGLFFMDFGGDTNVPVWWKSPYLIMPISMHYASEALFPPEGATVLTEQIGCDSGSFVFLPLSPQIPDCVGEAVSELIKQSNAVVLPLPSGLWKGFYEQFDSPQSNMVGLYRNIVLQHSPNSSRTRPNGHNPRAQTEA